MKSIEQEMSGKVAIVTGGNTGIGYGYKTEELLTSFLKEQERCYCTLFSFPPQKVNSKVKKTQHQNYDYFIHTLAELVEKYAPDILE